MSSLTLRDRALAYQRAFPGRKASWLHVVREDGRDVLYGHWMIGAWFKNPSPYYGSYPAGYLRRVGAMYADILSQQKRTLHAFSGSLGPGDAYDRCDVNASLGAEFACDVRALPSVVRSPYALFIADPPYTAQDAEKYGTPMINRLACTSALAQVSEPGAHLLWLDTCWPMHRKSEWTTVGRITILRSTNHRVRLLTIFERARGQGREAMVWDL